MPFGASVCHYLSLVHTRLDCRTNKAGRYNRNKVNSMDADEFGTLRGELVRTYTCPIEDDYYLDADQELGKGGCGVVVVGENKNSHSQYAIKIVNKTTGFHKNYLLSYFINQNI